MHQRRLRRLDRHKLLRASGQVAVCGWDYGVNSAMEVMALGSAAGRFRPIGG
jgi:hypothetical protein